MRTHRLMVLATLYACAGGTPIVDVPGEVKYRDASGGPHELFNLEDTAFKSILVEVKAAEPAK